jgi:DNA polymerase-3 subunit delta'
MMSLIYSKQTARTLDKITNSMPHALLLEGEVGTGLFTIASNLANNKMFAMVRPTDSKGMIDQESGSIKIAQIRELYDQTKGKSTADRFVIIDDADTMGLPAQNAFLKLLEEPVAGVHFILTAHRPEKLLPTIISRVQRVHIGKLTIKQTEELIHQLGVIDARKKSQLMYVAEGLPAEIVRLVSNSRLFDVRVKYMTDARTLLQGAPHERVRVVNEYHSKRSDALALIDAAQIILRRSIVSQPTKETITLADELADIHERIVANGNIKLQLLSVVV